MLQARANRLSPFLRHGLAMTLMVTSVVGCRPSVEEAAAPGDQADPADASPAELLLGRTIAFHDPSGAWSGFEGTLRFEEIRPGGDVRDVHVTLDVPNAGMVHRGQLDGRDVVREVGPDGCNVTVAGRVPTQAEAADLNLTCDRLERTRNYYHFLWGLPMKLRDPGTNLDPEVTRTSFQDMEVDQVRVTYDPEVGGDTWYFYFDTTTARMVGYRFYHDEALNDGEYITLEGEHEAGGMRIPANRRWFVNADDRFLGEDRLIGVAVGGT